MHPDILSLLPNAPDAPTPSGAAAPFSTGTVAAAVEGGVAHSGASMLDNFADWAPALRTADADLLPERRSLSARTADVSRNDAYVAGAARIHQNGIVGAWFTLNAKPKSAVLFGRRDETWETEFSEEVETMFSLWAESLRAWPDAARRLTFTEIIRLATGISVTSGEVLASAEWMERGIGRPYRTAIQMIDPLRLSNPSTMPGVDPMLDIRDGVERSKTGEPLAYYIQKIHPSDFRFNHGISRLDWVRVRAKTTWGRPVILHVYDQTRVDQSRGVSMMTTALKEMKMLSSFRRIELERAALASMYATSIEADLPAGDVYAAMGGTQANPAVAFAQSYLTMLSEYTGAANNLHASGAKIPVMAPGSRLKIQNPGAESPVGETFEASMLRHIAASLDLSYEELSRDYTKTNYSSAKAALALTWQAQDARKKMVADRVANFIFILWFEEAINRRTITALQRRNVPSFYEGLNAEAYTNCDWIGAGQGLIDPLKETQADVLALKSNLTTLEAVIARRAGRDWREVMRQIAREKSAFNAAGVPSVYEQDATQMDNALTGTPREATSE